MSLMSLTASSRIVLVGALALSLSVAPAAWASGASPLDATPAQQKSFDKKLAEANKLFKAGKFDKALEAFKAAHEVMAGPDARLMIARCQQNLGDLLAAHAEYSAAFEEAQALVQQKEKYRETMDAAQKELKELEGVLAKLTIKLIHAPEGTTVALEGEPVGAEKLGGPILLAPGPVTVIATDPEGREVSRQLTLNAGDDSKVDLAFPRQGSAAEAQNDFDSTEPEPEAPPEPSSSGGNKTLAFIAGGVGLAGLGVFGVFGMMSNSKFNDLEDSCVDNHCAPNRGDDIDAGKRDQTIANIGLAVGVVGIGTSAALFLFGGSGGAKKEEAASTELRLGVGSVQLRGRFQ